MTVLHGGHAPLEADEASWPVLSSGHGQLTLEGADHVEHTEAGLVFHRLPAEAISRIPMEFFRVVEAQPSGVRLVTTTRATRIELRVTTMAPTFFDDEPVASFGQFELLIDGSPHARHIVQSGGVRTMEVLTGTSHPQPGEPVTVAFDGLPEREKTVEIWLPHDVEVSVESILADASLATVPVPGRTDRPLWLHYGSSVSHGMNAETPTGIWPAVAAAETGASLMNLSFAGNAMLDPFVATVIRDREADLISLKIGINVVNHDGFRARTFVPAVNGFLDTIRAGHPTTPIWVVSAVLCPVMEDAPGPTIMVGPPGKRHADTDGLPHEVVGGRLSLSLTRDLLQQVIAWRSREDPNLHYLDGRELYGEHECAAMPMKDGLHPDSLAQRHIGNRFAELVLSGLRAAS